MLEGADALVASVDRYVISDISDSDNEHYQLASNLTLDSISFFIDDAGEIVPDQDQSIASFSTMNFALSVIRLLFAKIVEWGSVRKPFHLKIDTSQFYVDSNKQKLGLGSSAALTVSLIVTISRFLGIDKHLFPDNQALFSFASDAHFLAQGKKGSGIDIAASIFGGICRYNIHSLDQEGEDYRIVSIPVLNSLYILPIWTGRSASTRVFLSKLEQFRIEYSKEYQETMSRLSVLSEMGCETYQEKKCQDFLDIIKDYYMVLKNLSKKGNIPIISDIHELIAGVVYSNGAVYKPSGAGGGDIGIAFSDSKRVIENVKQKLIRSNIEIISLGISENGVIIME